MKFLIKKELKGLKFIMHIPMRNIGREGALRNAVLQACEC